MNIEQLNTPVAYNLQRIIDSKGLKQKYVAEEAGYAPRMLNDMINGRRVIKPADIAAFSKVLSVNPNDLFLDNPEPAA